PADLSKYLNAVVKVRGVVVYHVDADRKFHGEHIEVPAEDFISVEARSPDAPELPIVKRAEDLMRYNPETAPFQRVKSIGQIVHVRNGIFYLMNNTNGSRVVPKSGATPLLKPGTLVEAIGFPEIV